MVAIGDAENDHELLRVAEIGAAVEWGSASLQAAADIVVAGGGPSAVGEFIARISGERSAADAEPGEAAAAPRAHRRRPRILAGGARAGTC